MNDRLMEIILHRRNTTALLAATPRRYGVEIDLRSQGNELILQHDAFNNGERFDHWLDGYSHGRLILNVKEEGLEDRILALMVERGIQDFFFLDQSFPFLIRTVRTGERRCAVRVSEYESVETALALAGKVRWAWLDSFTDALPNIDGANRLIEAGFDVCLVSPELQGRSGATEIPRLRQHLAHHGIALAAVCTKEPERWT